MEAIAKAVEALGRQIKPAIFAATVASIVALLLPVSAWKLLGVPSIPIQPWMLAGLALFGSLFLSYESLVAHLANSQSKRGRQRALAQKSSIVLRLSARARALLFLLLKEGLADFSWVQSDTVIHELDAAGLVVPYNTLSGDLRSFGLSVWYREFAVEHRAWLLANLNPDDKELARIAKAWRAAVASDRV